MRGYFAAAGCGRLVCRWLLAQPRDGASRRHPRAPIFASLSPPVSGPELSAEASQKLLKVAKLLRYRTRFSSVQRHIFLQSQCLPKPFGTVGLLGVSPKITDVPMAGLANLEELAARVRPSMPRGAARHCLVAGSGCFGPVFFSRCWRYFIARPIDSRVVSLPDAPSETVRLCRFVRFRGPSSRRRCRSLHAISGAGGWADLKAFSRLLPVSQPPAVARSCKGFDTPAQHPRNKLDRQL